MSEENTNLDSLFFFHPTLAGIWRPVNPSNKAWFHWWTVLTLNLNQKCWQFVTFIKNIVLGFEGGRFAIHHVSCQFLSLPNWCLNALFYTVAVNLSTVTYTSHFTGNVNACIDALNSWYFFFCWNLNPPPPPQKKTTHSLLVSTHFVPLFGVGGGGGGILAIWGAFLPWIQVEQKLLVWFYEITQL